MGRCTGGNANKIVNGCIRDLESIRKNIEKNYNEMDIENANAGEEIEEIVNTMKGYCTQLIDELSGYSFE